MRTSPARFDRQRFLLAVALGVLIEIPLFLFGLHASLLFAEWSGGSLRAYWGLNGIYLSLGLAVALLLVRWHRLAVRLPCALVGPISLGLWGYLRG